MRSVALTFRSCKTLSQVEALDDLEAICSVDGLDCVVIGANDLSGAMGLPYLGSHSQVSTWAPRAVFPVASR